MSENIYRAPLQRHTRPWGGRTLALCIGALAAASALVAPSPSAALTLAGVRLPQSLSIGGERLVPVSCGVRDTLWVDHYVSALYVPRGASSSALLDASAPVAVLLRMVETRYLPDGIPHKWLGALEQSVAPRQLASIRTAYRRLGQGDRVLVEYRPDRGVTMRLNGRAIARIQGRGVIEAILAVWSDDASTEEKLRELHEDHPCPGSGTR